LLSCGKGKCVDMLDCIVEVRKGSKEFALKMEKRNEKGMKDRRRR
jgi:hypothetical protein